jgi:hypothetical protein
MTWKSYVVVSGASGLMATYLISPPLLPGRQPSITSGQEASARSAPPGPDIVEEAARLQARMRAAAVFREPARNPFRFGEPPAAPRRQAGAAAAEAPAAAAPSEPEPPFIVLSGIATDVVDGVPQRTAVLTTASGVALVRAGDMVGTEYRVRAIEGAAVDLESLSDRSIRRLQLPLTPP